MHVHIKRHLMKELPDTDDAVGQWCREVFVAKVITKKICHVLSFWLASNLRFELLLLHDKYVF